MWKVCATIVFMLCASVSARAQFTIRWITNTTPQAVEVEGIPRESLAELAASQAQMPPHRWMELFPIYAEQPVDAAGTPVYLPPIAGTWKIVGRLLRFEPQFPFTRGVVYRAEFWSGRLPSSLGIAEQLLAPTNVEPVRPVYSFLELPREKKSASTVVAQVYPTADVLPENQLKFYVHFSAPMSRGAVFEHVKLRGPDGKAIELPFLDLAEELWDLSLTRLTLLIDPGRIKRGVKPQMDIGPVFENGKNYTLTIEAAAKDGDGEPLAKAFVKTFQVGPADRVSPDPQRWKIVAPQAGSREPLTVTFDEPIDAALALRLISIVGPPNPTAMAYADPGERLPPNAKFGLVRGASELGERERVWRFKPMFSWMPGNYQLVVATTIEDLAGNNVGKTFDVDLAEGARRELAAQTVSVKFEVR